MKKSQKRDEERNKKPRRLKLSRETIKPLNDSAFLQLVLGGLANTSDSSTHLGTS